MSDTTMLASSTGAGKKKLNFLLSAALFTMLENLSIQPIPNFYSFAAMSSLQVKIINQSANPLPEYATHGSAGMDIRANLESSITLQPMERVLVPTGLYIELPVGYEAQVRPRSGLAVKQGITCLNTPGTIDADYRGEIKVILINLSGQDQVIHPADRIAQMVVQQVNQVEWLLVQEIAPTERGAGGFGHTGKH